MGFFFAWVPDGDTTFGVEHHIEDEEAFAFTLEHTENDFASLKLDVVNPRVGLLNDGRERWAWVAYQFANLTVVPMFHGRLVGFPDDMTQAIVTLEFLARPSDFVAQKEALAAILREAPYWDPMFVDKDQRADPDTVLAARSALWHIGRTDKTVTVSDIINGEDGTIELTGADFAAESLELSKGLPISKLHVEATVVWDQIGRGLVDLSDKLKAAFGGQVASYTGEGLDTPWPKHNDQIGAGWSVYISQANLLNTSILSSTYHKIPVNPALAIPDFAIEDWWADSPEGYDFWYNKALETWTAQKLLEPKTEVRFYLWKFNPRFVVAFEGSRSYSEVLSFDLVSDMQELVTTDDAEEPRLEEIKITSQSASEVIDGEIPIGRINRKSYFRLDRAKQTIDYVLSLARAKMLFAARCVEIKFNVSFEQGLAFSCRKNIQLTIDDLPGGVAVGKIIGYSLIMAEGGALSASVTIACTVGRGNVEAAPTAGDPSYAAPGYMTDYQSYSGGQLQPIAGEITYTLPHIVPIDDGLDMENLNANNAIGDRSATAVLALAGPGANNNTISIGARTYTLKTALSGADQILLGGTGEITAENIAAAINGDEVALGILYGAGTLANTEVSAVAQGGFMRATARVPGAAGNAIAVSRVGADLTWDHATLTDGGYGLVVINPPAAQLAALAPEYGSAEQAITALNLVFTEIELTMKPITGGPFVTPIALAISKLMVPKTIDLEAAA